LRALHGERFESLRCDARPEPIDRVLGPFCVSAGLIADRLELRNSLLQHRVREIGDAVLDRVVEPLELGVCFACSLTQLGDMRCSALRTLLAAAAVIIFSSDFDVLDCSDERGRY
jgi:hypothetical protein